MILALDIATKVGWAASDGRSGVADFTYCDDYAKVGIDFPKWLRHMLKGTTLCVIERPFGYGSRIYTVQGLAFTAHTVCAEHGIPRAEVSPPTWRKAVLGNGRAKKADAIKWARERGHEPETDDEAEALCILAWAVRGVHGQERAA